MNIKSVILVSIIILTISFPARAVGIHSMLTAHTHKQKYKKFLYKYVVTNLSDSEVSATSFSISIGESCHLDALTSPVGWSNSYSPEIPWVTWDAEKQRGIKPGNSASFTFTANCELTEQTFQILDSQPMEEIYRGGRVPDRNTSHYYSYDGLVDWHHGIAHIKKIND